jgi:uncharacterized protein (TIGR02145 family)
LTVFDTKTNQLAVWNGVLWVYLGSNNSSTNKGNLKIAEQPATFSFVERPGTDFNPTLSVTATNATSSNPAITYQWYSKKVDSSDDFSAISGATTATYTPNFGADTYGLYQYICRIAQRDSILSSNVAEIAYGCGAKTISGGWLTFMCHNLGADETKTMAEQMSYEPENIYDPTVYGDLYQWGRKKDGHEKRDSQTTTTLATNVDATEPADVTGKFIIGDPNINWNWYTGEISGTLWKINEKGPHDPCPTGWRISTEYELRDIVSGYENAFAIPGNYANRWEWYGKGLVAKTNNIPTLLLPASGRKGWSAGTLIEAGERGRYWAMRNHGDSHLRVYISFVNTNVTTYAAEQPANGYSVRCTLE